MKSLNKRGFVALLSTIIISVVLLLVITTGSFLGFYGRSNMLDAELKARSSAAADACADAARLKLAQNLDPGDIRISINSLDQCRIGPVTGTIQKTFRIQATSSDGAVTNLQITFTMTDFSIVSWQEISTF